MSTKFGTSRFGTSVYSDVPNLSGVIKQPNSFSPHTPSFFNANFAKDIQRRHYLGLTQWGTKFVLYQRKLKGDSFTLGITSFDTTTPNYSKTIWTRGNSRIANPIHPDVSKFRVKTGGFYLTQVRNEQELFGSFSFCIKSLDKSMVLIFSKGFVQDKLVIMEFDTICNCVDSTSLQSSNPRCPICYGTNFEGGYDRYYSPEQENGYIYIRQRFSPKAFALKDQGFMVQNQAEFWTLPEPAMKDKDIVEQVDGSRKSQRFFINNWNLHTIGLYDTSQVFQMTELTPTDPSYAADFL